MANHLVNETSPYLRQHAGNPVDWRPWGPEALRLAREQDKPILLSIGYSSCHWCHVMAHESFEDAGVAALMNALFVNIKVDREERPDLDQIYQAAHYLLVQGSGGWPLTMFLTPDGTPFFGGTYFPKFNSHNLPAFPDVLQRAAEVYREKRHEVALQNKDLVAALARAQPQPDSAADLQDAPLHLAMAQLGENFDPVHGGFGAAPKFPQQPELDFLLRRSAIDARAHNMALYSLEQMANGGIFDHLSGGFYRYSVDEYWNIPHFEKMLYDNGQLLALYSDAWLCSGKPQFAQVTKETASWVMRKMQASEGGYYSSLDADSEHEEGKFYVWQRDEIRGLLNAQEYAVAELHYGLDRPPNFDQIAWHLHVSMSMGEVAASLQLSAEEAEKHLSSARQKLYTARARRVHPARDEKILASWNGLMITGMARAARAMQRHDWLESAQRAMDFVRSVLWRDGRLLATCKDGRAHLNAYLDDHAFLLQAALELVQAAFRREDLDFAIQLADALLERFEDRQNGGFFFTSHDHEALIQRPKVGQDSAMPSGNGVAALALQRMALVTGKLEYADAAERCLKLFFPLLQQVPSAHGSLCTALSENLRPASLLVLRGKPNELDVWQGKLRRRYFPDVLIITPPENTDGLPEPLVKPTGEHATAWLCRGTQCLPPITRIEELLSALGTT